MEEFPLARRHYQEVVRDHPDSEAAPEAQLAIAWTWLKEGRALEAAAAFHQVVEDYPDHESVGEACYREGVALREAGRNAEALPAFAAAVEIPANPWADDALLEAGLIHYREGRFPLARAAFERILELGAEGPLAADAAEMVAECRLAEGGLEEADAAFDRVVKTWPDTEAGRLALFQWSVVRLRRGAASEAATGFERYRTRFPDSDLAAEALYQQAESEYRAGRWDRSAALYQSYRQAWPDGAHALESEYGTGWSRFSAGDWTGAIEAFRRVVSVPAGEASLQRDARLRIADAYYNLHRYRDAAVTYREVLQRDPGAADADRVALSAGDAFIRAEAYESALPVLGEIVTRFPAGTRYDDALFWRGWALFRMGEYERAVAEYRKVLEQRPPSELEPNARYAIGDAWYNAGRYPEALSAYRELALAHPADQWLAEAVGGMQWALVQLGRADEAERAADEQLTPSTPAGVRERVRLQQARFLFDLERHVEAVPVLQGLAGGGTPEVSAEALFWLARSLTVLGRAAEAEAALTSLLREHPDSAFTSQARLRLADLQIARSANGEAIRTLEPLLDQLLPERAEALYLSAAAHRSLGDATRTEVELRRLIDEYPGSPLAAQGRLRMAELALERGNFNIAQNEVNTLLAERTDELAAEAQYLAGEILFAQQRWSDAEVQFLKVRYVYPAFGDWIARALLRAAQADLRLGNTEKARSLLETALRDHPNAPAAAQVRAELERIRP
jgi:TolA-binding protein